MADGFNIDKVPTSIDFSNGGTIALPSSWVTQVNALIAAAGGGVSGLTAGRLPYAASATTLADSANATLDANGAMLVKYLSLQSSAAGLNDIGGIFSSLAAQKWALQLGASQELIIQDFVNAKNVIKLTPAATPTVTLLGNLVFNSDNAYDIGASGATRPKNIYAAGTLTANAGVVSNGNVAAGATSQIYFNARATIASPSDGIITLANYVSNDFTRLQFGGTTSSFPSIKRNGTGLDIRLADDSGYAALTVGGTVTGSDTTSFNTISGVWNTTGVITGALTINITNTASATGSALINAKIGSNTIFGVTKAGFFGSWGNGAATVWGVGSIGIDQGYAIRTGIASNGAADSFAFQHNGIRSYGVSATAFRVGVANLIGFVNGVDAFDNALDSTFSRISAGVIGVGTGAAASVAGTIQAAKYIGGSGSAAAVITATGASVSGQYVYINTSSQVANDVGFGITFGGAITGALLGYYYQGTASAGFTNRLSNADNTNSTANASHRITVGGSSAGDAFTRYEVAGVTDWSIGIDNSNSDSFTIGPNADPSTGNAALTIHPTTYLFTIKDAAHWSFGSGTGSKLGNATGEKLGFWGVTPVVQQVLATGAAHTVDDVITMLQTLGLCKQS